MFLKVQAHGPVSFDESGGRKMNEEALGGPLVAAGAIEYEVDLAPRVLHLGCNPVISQPRLKSRLLEDPGTPGTLRPPGMVSGIRKCRITPHSVSVCVFSWS